MVAFDFGDRTHVPTYIQLVLGGEKQLPGADTVTCLPGAPIAASEVVYLFGQGFVGKGSGRAEFSGMRVATRSGGVRDTGGLEWALHEATSGAGDGLFPTIMTRVLGRDRSNPWRDIGEIARSHLVETGLLEEVPNPKKRGLWGMFRADTTWVPKEERLREARGAVPRAKALLDEASSKYGELWAMVPDEIARGISECEVDKGD